MRVIFLKSGSCERDNFEVGVLVQIVLLVDIGTFVDIGTLVAVVLNSTEIQLKLG